MVARRTLSRTIFVVLFSVSFVVMLAATVAATAASFHAYEREAEQILLSQADAYAETLADCKDDDMAETLAEMPLVDTRCTLVASDGSVLYDNRADPATMKNHADREEVVAAKTTGQITLMRKSDTLGTYTLYAATLVRDGIVVRLADTRTSLMSFLGGMALPLAVSLIAIFAISFLVSQLLTRMIVQPLRDIDLANPMDNKAYEELQPLLKRVDEQYRTLEDQNEQLEKAVALRREFAGNVSHEMKTPLQVIGGYAELMEGGMVDAGDVPRFASVIRDEAESMRALIDDVLTLSRLDEAAPSADGIPVSPAEVCRRVAQRLAAEADSHDVHVHLDLDDSALVVGDEPLFEHMVYNLVDNAIKYNNPGGRVDIVVTTGEDGVHLSVADEGSGIPEELRERIFERFFCMDTSRSREKGGTGLGLAIVKHAVDAFGGSVEVGTSSSGGAEFKVVIPESGLQIPSNNSTWLQV